MYPYSLIAENLGYQVIFGRDFLHKHHAVIDLKNGKLQLSENNFISLFCNSTTVHVLKTVTIPPRSQSVIPAKLRDPMSENTVGLIESNSRLAERYRLSGACELATVSCNNTVPFRILNPNTIPVTLYRNTNLGTFTDMGHDVKTFSLDDVGTQKSNTSSAQTQTTDSSEEIPVDWSKSQLTEEQKEKLKVLLAQYRDVFALKPGELGKTSVVKHHIETETSPPIKQRPYRAPQATRDVIDEHVQQMLDDGIIQPSMSPWSSPVVLVRKKDNSIRFCVDYRKLNEVTKKDSYPLPRIDDTLDTLGGTAFFSTLDLKSGYWQVELDEESREKTAFVTHAGLYEFLVLPFGLTNAPSTFERLMEIVLRGLTWKICLIYIDDIIVFSKTFEEHLQHLELVFQRLREANIKLKPSKCHFGKSEVRFLGHVVSKDGGLPDPEKIKVVKEFPIPKNARELKSFLGLAQYYKRFVKDYSMKAAVLNKLTSTKTKVFEWTPECQKAFETLKNALTNPPILAYPDFSQTFQLQVDASNTSIGYVLSQIQNNKEVAIAYSGRSLIPAEQKRS